MDALDALVRMRYRPSGDVLLGQVERFDAHLGAPGPDGDGPTALADDHQERIEHLDADTTRTWRLVTEGPDHGRSMLVGFRLVGIGARLRAGRSSLGDILPVPLARAAGEMIASADGATARRDVDDRVRARAEVSLFVPRSQLLSGVLGASGQRGEDAPSALPEGPAANPADLGAARALAGSLTPQADSLQAELAQLPAARRVDPGDHAERFVDALRVLASVVSRHRLPAPGAATLAIDAVRGGLPLSGTERTLLRELLAEMDDISRWRDAARALETLATTLDDQRSRRPDRAR